MKRRDYQIVFLVAWEDEINKIFLPVGYTRIETNTPYKLYEKDNCLVVETGVSKTMAAAATQWALDNFTTSNWINIGFCGTLTSKFTLGEVVKVSECRLHDLDVRGLRPNCKIGQISPNEEYSFELKTTVLPELPEAKCISGDMFVTNKQELDEIVQEYKPDLVEMEVASIAWVMKINGKLDSLMALKVPSDNADANAGNDSGNIEEKLLKKIVETINQLSE